MWVDCAACFSQCTGTRVTLQCEHVYDSDCVVKLVEASLTDPVLFPVKCCGQEIPLDLIRDHVSATLFARIVIKVDELANVLALNCANPRCGANLGTRSDQRQSLVCDACGTTTCSECASTHAADLTCTQSVDGQALAELAKLHGWQRCPDCRRMIELNEGCFHITCFCSKQFCYLCAATWKTCACPQFNVPEERFPILDEPAPQPELELVGEPDAFD